MTVGKLAEALAKAQGQMKGAAKDTTNPFFKSKYADLASVWEACRHALSENGLSIVQPTIVMDSGDIAVKTILMHSSGETIEGILPVKLSDNATAQQLGSYITYNRRYALAAMVGVAPEEDDGNSASEAPKHLRAVSKPVVSTLKERADAFCSHLSKLKTSLSVTNLVTSNNGLLFELKEKMPDEYEAVSVAINKIQQSFNVEAAE